MWVGGRQEEEYCFRSSSSELPEEEEEEEEEEEKEEEEPTYEQSLRNFCLQGISRSWQHNLYGDKTSWAIVLSEETSTRTTISRCPKNKQV